MNQDLEKFLTTVRARLEVGTIEFDDKSFGRSSPELLDEIQQELADVCGWAAILFARLERLRRAMPTGGPA